MKAEAIKTELQQIAQRLDVVIAAAEPDLSPHELRSLCRGTGFLRAAVRSLTERGVQALILTSDSDLRDDCQHGVGFGPCAQCAANKSHDK